MKDAIEEMAPVFDRAEKLEAKAMRYLAQLEQTEKKDEKDDKSSVSSTGSSHVSAHQTVRLVGIVPF